MDDDWQPIHTAPCNIPLELGAFDSQAVRSLGFPCRLSDAGWLNALTNSKVAVEPSHWREWRLPPPALAGETSTFERTNRLLIGAELSKLYDEFLHQPVPPRMTELLDQLAQQELRQFTQRQRGSRSE